MKLKSFLIITFALFFISNQSHANNYFKEWCDTYTAQGLISLSANRIFGSISTLNSAEYNARTEWVNTAYKISERRFKKLTGHDFLGYEHKQSSNWVARCQLKDQIK